jgi:hypothetical protein
MADTKASILMGASFVVFPCRSAIAAGKATFSPLLVLIPVLVCRDDIWRADGAAQQVAGHANSNRERPTSCSSAATPMRRATIMSTSDQVVGHQRRKPIGGARRISTITA